MRNAFQRGRSILTMSLAMAVGAGLPASVVAQDAEYVASPYLPLGSVEYPIIEYWISAGRINSLSPFTKPYRRIEVASALQELDEAGLSEGELGWLAELKVAFASELAMLSGSLAPDARVTMQLDAGGEFTTQTHRDLLRPELDGEFSDSEFLGRFGADFEGAAGSFAGAVRGRYDGIFREDAQFPGGEVVKSEDARLFGSLAFRMEEAYVEAQSRYARLSFGQMYRNWGAPGLPGFLRADYAYSEPEIGYRFGTEKVFLTGTFASYRDFEADTAHYVAIHRLEVRPSNRLMLALSESSVHGGSGQGVDFQLVNPLSVWAAARADDDPQHNKTGLFDIWWRAAPGLTTYATVFIDAFRAEESKFAGSFGVELPRLAPAFLLRANFSFVQSLTYTANNSSLPWEEYSVERIGIGWDKTDLYLISLEGEWFPHAGLWLKPKLDIQIQGEGDLRKERPPPEELKNFPHILVGQTETTVRPALAGRWRHDDQFRLDLEWDVGVNIIRDYDHINGSDRTEFVGSLTVRLQTPRWEFGL